MHAVNPEAGGHRSPAFYRSACKSLVQDERYLRHLDWGEPREGHPEGSLRAHLADLERNAAYFLPRLSEVDGWRLRLLIHAHDTFKPEAAEGAKITDPGSHASLARAFLAEFCPDDAELLNMVQFHDEPYALWRQERHFRLNRARLDALFSVIRDWDLYLVFLIVDGCTEGKGREPLHWFLAEAVGRVSSRVSAVDIL